MANVVALRDKIVELCIASAGRFTVNDLFARLNKHHGGYPPVSRAALYSWFGTGGEPRQAMLECLPSFAAMFDVPEHELWSAAGVLPEDFDISRAVASSVHDLRNAHRGIQKALADTGFSSAGEALVVDRILHHKLDYRMQVWPVVRGISKPLHLHSWLLLQPLDATESSRRQATTILEGLAPDQRRRYLREAVITENLWRALGLQWRDRLPAEYAWLGSEPLFIEVPVEERNRPVPAERVFPHLHTDRVLVLGSAWSHAELMVALAADALGFGSLDLRYLSLPPGRDTDRRVRYCRERLTEARSRTVWAIAQRSDVLRELRGDILAAARPGQLIVLMSMEERLLQFAAAALGTKLDYLVETESIIEQLTTELIESRDCDVISVHIGDDDVMGSPDERLDEPVIRDRMVDIVRHLTAGVLDRMYWHRGGPGLTRWGDRFADLRVGDEESPDLDLAGSWVDWYPMNPPDRGPDRARRAG